MWFVPTAIQCMYERGGGVEKYSKCSSVGDTLKKMHIEGNGIIMDLAFTWTDPSEKQRSSFQGQLNTQKLTSVDDADSERQSFTEDVNVETHWSFDIVKRTDFSRLCLEQPLDVADCSIASTSGGFSVTVSGSPTEGLCCRAELALRILRGGFNLESVENSFAPLEKKRPIRDFFSRLWSRVTSPFKRQKPIY